MKSTNYNNCAQKTKFSCTVDMYCHRSLGIFHCSDLGKTWIIEKIDNLASIHIRKWLEIPISGTSSNVLLPNNKFGLNIILPSAKFLQCQTVCTQRLY